MFVEELTKSVMEAVRGHGLGRPCKLAIPATLQEALLARLDRLSTARQVAQLGATLGREFSHELLQAVTPLSEADLHAALDKAGGSGDSLPAWRRASRHGTSSSMP